MKTIIWFFFICGIFQTAHAQTAWELKRDKENIKVYSAATPNSNLKMVKVNCVLHATLSQLTALLMDSKAHEDWVYNTKTSYLVRQVNASHLIYYSETSLPWPLANRDVVVDMTVTQDSLSRVLKVNSNSIAAILPDKKGVVRVPLSKVEWTVTPIGNNELSIEYIAQADPGGSVPAWIVNAFLTKGPFETFKKLKELVASPAYSQVPYAFIQN